MNDVNRSVAIQKRDTLRDLLGKSKSKLALALPKHLDADKLIAVAMSAIISVPKLLDCSKISILQSVMESARLGLYPDGILGHGWILPYKGVAQFIPGYRGLIDLARRSGHISNVFAFVVYAKDKFGYQYGLEPALIHEPFRGGERGDPVAVYGVVVYKDGTKHFEVMEARDVEAVKRRSPAARASFSPWNHPDDWAEMWRKTAIRRVLKYAPMSVEVQRAVAIDEQFDAGLNPPQAIDVDFSDITGEADPGPADPLDALAGNLSSGGGQKAQSSEQESGAGSVQGSTIASSGPVQNAAIRTRLVECADDDCNATWEAPIGKQKVCPKCGKKGKVVKDLKGDALEDAVCLECGNVWDVEVGQADKNCPGCGTRGVLKSMLTDKTQTEIDALKAGLK